jgi:hypothetical protein
MGGQARRRSATAPRTVRTSGHARTSKRVGAAPETPRGQVMPARPPRTTVGLVSVSVPNSGGLSTPSTRARRRGIARADHARRDGRGSDHVPATIHSAGEDFRDTAPDSHRGSCARSGWPDHSTPRPSRRLRRRGRDRRCARTRSSGGSGSRRAQGAARGRPCARKTCGRGAEQLSPRPDDAPGGAVRPSTPTATRGIHPMARVCGTRSVSGDDRLQS